MNYADARPLIRSGDLLAWSHRSWSSFYDLQIQAVRFFTQSEYCHVGIAWVIGGRVLVIEAVSPLLRIYPLSRLGDFYHLPMDAEWTPTVEEFALSIVGTPYSKVECIKSFFEPASETLDVMQCAKAARLILGRCGIDVGNKATPSAIVQSALEFPGAELHYVTQGKTKNERF